MAGRSSSRSGNRQPTTHWLNVSWDDIVERLALVFYTDESFETVDYLNVMLLGWALFALFVYVVGTLLANRFGRQRVAASAKKVDGQEPVEETVSAGSAHEQHAAAAGRWANAKEPVPFAVSASGSDPDAVLWTNRVLSWVLARKQHEFLSKPWIQALNEKLAKSPPKIRAFNPSPRGSKNSVHAPFLRPLSSSLRSSCPRFYRCLRRHGRPCPPQDERRCMVRSFEADTLCW